MGKRYGRNQKRRHREEITRLKEAYGMADGLCKYLGENVRKYQDTIQEMSSIIEGVSKYSVVLPPKSMEGRYPRKSFSVEMLSATLRPEVPSIDDVFPDTLSYSYVDVYALEVFVERHRDKFATCVHMVYSGGGETGYMISKAALLSAPNGSFARRFAPQIARELEAALKKDVARL